MDPQQEELRRKFIAAYRGNPRTIRFPSLVPGQPDNPMVEKEIGPEGGMVELENVARLEIPAGALDSPTLIKIFQVLELDSTKEQSSFLASDVPPGMALPGYDFITPVVRLEPFGLRLNIPALLYLPTDAMRVGNKNPMLIKSVASSTAQNGSWSFNDDLDALGTPEAPAVIGIDSPIKVKRLVYIAKQFPTNIQPDPMVEPSFGQIELSRKREGPFGIGTSAILFL